MKNNLLYVSESLENLTFKVVGNNLAFTVFI